MKSYIVLEAVRQYFERLVTAEAVADEDTGSAFGSCFCGRDDYRRLIQLARLAKQLNLRIVITSRPESDLPAAFEKVKPSSIRLEEVEGGTEEDIRRLLRYRFEGFVKQESTENNPRVNTGWPGDTEKEGLARLCKSWLIFASTICRYVTESKPKSRLAEVLDEKYSANLKGIQRIYFPILEHVLKDAKDDTKIKTIVGSIILLQKPLPANELSSLLNLDLGDVWHLLRRLQSVLRVSDDLSMPIRTLHKSSRDFLLDLEHPFRIDITSTHSLTRLYWIIA